MASRIKYGMYTVTLDGDTLKVYDADNKLLYDTVAHKLSDTTVNDCADGKNGFVKEIVRLLLLTLLFTLPFYFAFRLLGSLFGWLSA